MKQRKGVNFSLAWAKGYRFAACRGNLFRFSYDLAHMARRGVLPQGILRQFRRRTHLGNFFWRLYYNGTKFSSPQDALLRADGQVVFIHGWDGTGGIWESLPWMVCKAEPRLIALVPDVNGFGRSRFWS